MGRMAANRIYHSHRRVGNPYQSSFSSPITIDSLYAIVATNAIATGPGEFINLVSHWIMPNKKNLPPVLVVAVTYHLASEAMGKCAPCGTRDALKNILFVPVMTNVLAPLPVATNCYARESNCSAIDGWYEHTRRLRDRLLRISKVSCIPTQ